MTEKNDNRMSFRITGMTCTTCSRLVEKALSKIPGVSFASVNLSTESAFVIADKSVTFEMLKESVKKSGYDILKDVPADIDEIRYREARKDLFFIMLLGIPMTLIMLIHMITGTHFHWYGITEVIAGGAAIFWGGRKTLRGAWIAITHLHTNMDTLIAISATASWLTAIMSTAGFRIPSFGTIGVMILMLHLSGRYIESRLRDKAAKQIKSLMTLQPREARVILDETFIMIPVEAVKPETVIQVNPGERIPLDGIVTDGLSGVDESMLTGESLPVAKDAGTNVIGGSMNLSGVLKIRTTKAGEDTFLSKMLDLVQKAQGSKVPLQAFADRITLKFVPIVITLAVISAAAWFFLFDSMSVFFAPLAGYLPWPTAFASPASTAAYVFVATLVIACPCALGLATPLALVAAAGEASRSGLLIRNAEAIQTLHDVNYAVLDKTGTLTKGQPKVVECELPEYARPYVFNLEKNSGHPLAAAVINAIGEQPDENPDSISEIPGEGVKGKWGKTEWFVGRPLARYKWTGKSALSRTIVEVRQNEEPVGFFGISDTLREDSQEAVASLHDLGITPVIATGDGKETALEIAHEAGIDNVYWEVHPADKLFIIQEAQSKGKKVLMVGDGINDAAALKGAHVGIAIGGGMDLAVDSSDIVILKGGLSKIVSAVRISKKTWTVIRQNLFGAFFYNIIAIPLAMSGLLHPIAAELAMAGSSLTVILNSLRILGSADK